MIWFFALAAPRWELVVDIGVSTAPGLNTVVLIFRSLSSLVHLGANDRSAALVALQVLRPESPLFFPADATRMMEALFNQVRQRPLNGKINAAGVD